MVWFAGSYVCAVLGFFALNAVAGRWLGPDDFGLMVAALTATGLLGQVGLIGSHRSGLREAARLRGTDDPVALGALRNGVLAVCRTTLPLAGLVAAVGAYVLAPRGTVTDRLLLGAVLFVSVQLVGQQQLWANYARGFGHVRLASLLEGRSGGALVAVGQAALALLAWQLVPGWGLLGALGAVALGYVVPLVVSRRVVRGHWPRGVGPRLRLRADLGVVVRRDWKFLTTQVATFLNTSTEIWIAAAVLSAVDTSMYSAGQRLAMVLVLPLTLVQVVLAPVIARAVGPGGARTEEGSRRLERLVRTAASVATALALLMAVPLLVAPTWVIGLLYGPGFSAAAPVLVLLSLGCLGNVATGAAGTALSMLGREGVAARVQWVGVVFRVGVGVPAAVAYGLSGLTVSALAAACVVFTMMWWSARSAVGISTHATVRPDLGLLRRTAG